MDSQNQERPGASKDLNRCRRLRHNGAAFRRSSRFSGPASWAVGGKCSQADAFRFRNSFSRVLWNLALCIRRCSGHRGLQPPLANACLRLPGSSTNRRTHTQCNFDAIAVTTPLNTFGRSTGRQQRARTGAADYEPPRQPHCSEKRTRRRLLHHARLHGRTAARSLAARPSDPRRASTRTRSFAEA